MEKLKSSEYSLLLEKNRCKSFSVNKQTKLVRLSFPSLSILKRKKEILFII